MPKLFDVESRSRCDLKKHGSRRYWADPSTEVLCIAWFDTDTEEPGYWVPGMPCPFGPDDLLAAHNYRGFDRFALERLGWRSLEDGLHDIDTAELARKAGLPGALDALGTRWLGIPKDKAASRFTTALSTCRRPTKKTAHLAPEGEVISAPEWKALSNAEKRARGYQQEITPEMLERVLNYCISDVEIMAHGWPLLEDWLEVDTEANLVDRAINDRGVYFDSALALRLLEEDARLGDEAIAEVAEHLGWTPAEVRAVAKSPEKFCEATGAPNAQKETVAAMVAEGDALAYARQALASIARGKLEAGLAMVMPDGRLYDTHKFYGAHTGRWSSKGMQLHNMPRPAECYESWTAEQIQELAVAVINGRPCTREEIDLLLRACIRATPGQCFTVVDFSGVEARALAFYAGDKKSLHNIATERDIYKIAATAIYGVDYDEVTKAQRQAGKMAELACGYQGWVNALIKMAEGYGIDLAETGAEPKEIVMAWRTLHFPVVQFWKDVENAFLDAAKGYDCSVGAFRFVSSDDGKDVAIFLPSGRPIVYNDVKISRETRYGKLKETLSFRGTKSGREYTYGGKLVENIIQATTRDLLAAALVRLEAEGFRPVLHVHDESVSEGPVRGAKARLKAHEGHMITLPDWAEGFPIGAEGFISERYRK